MDTLNLSELLGNVGSSKSKIQKESFNHKEAASKTGFESAMKKVNPKSIEKKDIATKPVKKGAKSILAKKEIQPKKNDYEEKEEIDSSPPIDLIAQKIMAAIQEILGIKPEQVQQILEKLNIQITDLSNESNFQLFLQEAFQTTDMHTLLQENEQLKDIGKLQEVIEQLSVLIGEDQITYSKVTDAQTGNIQEQVVEVEKVSVPQKEEVINQGIVQQLTNGVKKESELKPFQQSSQDVLLSDDTFHQNMIPVQALNELNNMSLQYGMQKNQLSYQNIPTESINIVDQMVTKLEVSALKNQQEIQMELSPKELGKLSIKLTETNGTLSASIHVETEKTRVLLESQLQQLKETLISEGITIGDFTVDIRKDSHQSQMEQQKQKSSKRILDIFDQLESEEVFEEPDKVILQDTEVDYMV